MTPPLDLAAGWLDCPDCRARSKSGAEPPRCDVHVCRCTDGFTCIGHLEAQERARTRGTLDLAAGRALCAVLEYGPYTANHRYVVSPSGDVAQCAVVSDAAALAWLATHWRELLRDAAVGQAVEREPNEAVEHERCAACGRPRHDHNFRHVFVRAAQEVKP